MLVTVTCSTNDAVYSLDVSPDMELENFKVLVQVESNSTDVENLVFFHNGKILFGDKKTLKELGVENNDVLLFGPLPENNRGPTANAGGFNPPATRLENQQQSSNRSGINWGSIEIPSTSSQSQRQPVTPANNQVNKDDPEIIRLTLLKDPHQMALLKERNPELAGAINKSDDFRRVLEKQRKERQEQEMARIRLLAANPFDQEAQRQIAEEIRMENVNQNMQTAMEYNPEAFAQVYMLYINCKVNGQPVKAFVDSGAQMTIMSQACAERCNVMRLIDHRWQGLAVGVGQQRILGRIHMGEMQIENDFLPTSFTILEEQKMDILLGLDMLKRHQCCIDLKRNCLVIGTTATETRFLSESELPPCARLNNPPSDLVNHAVGTMNEEEDKQLAQALDISQKEFSGGASGTGNS